VWDSCGIALGSAEKWFSMNGVGRCVAIVEIEDVILKGGGLGEGRVSIGPDRGLADL